MRWFFNCLLVLAGFPLVGTTFVLIGSFTPALKEESPWPIRLCLFAVWLSSLGLFACAYAGRTRWLERCGIYKSWSNFEAYVKENHGHPCVSEQEKTAFLSWAGLSGGRPAQFRKALRALYRRIHAEIGADQQRRSYIKCLAWYADGWPVREDCHDLYGNDDWRLPSKDA